MLRLEKPARDSEDTVLKAPAFENLCNIRGYLKVLDPYKASYGVDDFVYAVTQLAQTTMRSEIG